MNILQKAKAIPVAKTAAAKKTKAQIEMKDIERLAELHAYMKSIAAMAGTLEAEIKEAGFAQFLEMAGSVRPESFKGVEGNATCSVEMRKRGTNSALSEDEAAALESVGLKPFKQIVTQQLYGINPIYATDEALMAKVSKALAKIIPDDFIVVQEERSKLVVDDALLDAAFKLSGDQAAHRPAALRICTTMALKPALTADYDISMLNMNVASYMGAASDEVEVA